jgi:serine/threonine protein kinase
MARLRAIAGDAPINEGERLVVDALVKHLPPAYGVFPNFETSDRRGHRYEYDVVVTAPHAVYVIETKAYSGRVEGDDREWLVNDRVQPAPIRLTSHKARVLKGLLQDNVPALRDAWVEPAVVLAYPPKNLQLTKSARAHTFSIQGLIEFAQNASQVPDRRTVDKLIDRAERVLASVAQKRSGPLAFGDWRVIEVLEADGEVAEYRARHQFASGAEPKRLRVVALSPYLLAPEELEEQRKKVVREFTALTTMGAHPNVAAVDQAFEEGSNVVLVSSELEGMTLGLALAEGLDVEDTTRLRWLDGLCHALAHAHTHGVIHRRIAPENCILTNDGSLRLTGFGSAHVATEGTIHHDAGSIDVDMSYVAPELLDGLGAATPAADVFGCGCIAYALWAGEAPFAESWRSRTAAATQPDGMPEGIWAAVEPMLRGDADARPESLNPLLGALRAARAPDPTPVPPEESPPVAAPGELRPGEVFDDRYRVESVLGTGAFATVYEALDQVAEELVALKVLRPGHGLQTAGKEFKALVNIQHPNVVRVRHCDRSHTQPVQWFVLMELAHGQPLQGYTSGDVGHLSLETSLRIADQLLDALISFHPDAARIAALKAQEELDETDLWELQRLESEGLVHRDIKPQNILYDATNGQVKILDFNIASPAGSQVLTVSGTPPYQPGDADLTAWSVDPDLFAVSVVLYELITGEHPYEERNPTKGEPIDPRTRADVPDWLADFVLKGCASEQARRFKTAVEMRAALVLPENPEPVEPEDTFSSQLADRIEAEGLHWDAVGIENLADGGLLLASAGGLLLTLYRDGDELRLALEVDGDDVDGLRELRRRQEAIERRAGVSLIPFESSASAWHAITEVDEAVSWVIDTCSRLDAAVTDVFVGPEVSGDLEDLDPGVPLAGAEQVLLLTTTEGRIPVFGVPHQGGGVVRQGRTVDGRSYPAPKPSPIWLPNGSSLAFDHAVQGEWVSLRTDGGTNPMAGEQQADGSWVFTTSPGSDTLFGPATVRVEVVDAEGAAGVGLSIYLPEPRSAPTAEAEEPHVDDGDFADFIRQRAGGNRAREELVTSFVSQAVADGEVVVDIGRSGTTSDGRSNYLMLRRAGPRRLGALAYVKPGPGTVDFRVPAIAARDRAHASLRTDATYQVKVPIHSTGAVDEALSILTDAIHHHDGEPLAERAEREDELPVPASPVQTLIDRVRAAAGGDRVAVRVAAEERARRLLDARGGRLTEPELTELLSGLKTDLLEGEETATRFPGSFLQTAAGRLGGQMERVNYWLGRLWGPDDNDAQAAADALFRENGSGGLPGAGSVFPAVMLYLRDPDRWVPVNAPIKRGASALGVGATWERAKGIDGFRRWSDEVHAFCRRYSISVHEVDAIFTAADPGPAGTAKEARARRHARRSKAENAELLRRIRIEKEAGNFDTARSMTPHEWIAVQDEINRAEGRPARADAAATPSRSLELQFHDDMATLGRRTAKETGYRPTRFMQMIGEHGGLSTAQTLLRASAESEGFRELWERKRLDLAAENLVLLPKYASLFTDEERQIAKRRLDAYGYPAK